MSQTEESPRGKADRLYWNGIDGATGEYLFPSMSVKDLLPSILKLQKPQDPKPRRVLGLRDVDDGFLGVRDGIDTHSLSQAGWGVVLPSVPSEDTAGRKAQAALLDALEPLLQHRQSQAGHLYKVFDAERGCGPQESARGWVERHGASADIPVDPRRGVPYYLLLVGSPEELSFEFQYELDVEYAVGRIHFDTLEEYAHYARSVVEAERGRVRLPRRVALFGTRNPGDMSTEMSNIMLTQPVHRELSKIPAPWAVEAFLGEAATKSRLAQLLGGPQRPALLFTASHGMGFSNIDHPRLRSHTGALVCQDWPGPGNVPMPEHLFAAEDVGSEARLHGMVAFFFACFGAGLPSLQDFPSAGQSAPRRLAPRAFLSQLPRRLLSHEHGGALAVIGHVERAWGSSFMTRHFTRGADLFEDCLKRLMRGDTVGAAMELFSNRYSRKAVELTGMMSGRSSGEDSSRERLVESWIEMNDARNYIVLGDPAVRLQLE